MCCTSQSCPSRKRVNLSSIAVIVGACFVTGLATAQESSTPLVPQAIHWLAGPSQAAIGNVGTFEVPRGYRFADAGVGRTMLESLHQQVPEGLVGIVSPSSGQWVMALSYSAVGYVKDANHAKFDSDALLKSLWDETSAGNKARAENKLPAIVHINWALKPSYDSEAHVLQWAIKQDAVSDREKNVLYIGRVLGRHGYIQGLVVSRDISDYGELNKLLANASLKPGERYADFKAGDHAADFELVGLVARDPNAAPVDNVWTSSWLLLGAGTGVLTAVVLAIVVVRGRKSQKRAFEPQKVVEAAVPRPAAAHTNGAKASKMNIARAIVGQQANGHAHVNGSGHVKVSGTGDGKKRRMFNYQKFYTEMMLQGPSPVNSDSYVKLAGQTNGNGDTEHFVNGEAAAPHVNGNGHVNGYAQQNGSNPMVHAQAEIIAGQKSLIEDQRRLIHEQSRLIEEKTRLISEKTALLHKQSQMIDHNLL